VCMHFTSICNVFTLYLLYILVMLLFRTWCDHSILLSPPGRYWTSGNFSIFLMAPNMEKFQYIHHTDICQMHTNWNIFTHTFKFSLKTTIKHLNSLHTTHHQIKNILHKDTIQYEIFTLTSILILQTLCHIFNNDCGENDKQHVPY
jgi:hypothetical protein